MHQRVAEAKQRVEAARREFLVQLQHGEHLVGDTRRSVGRLRPGDHGGVGVDGDNLSAGAGIVDGFVAGAAAYVQHRLSAGEALGDKRHFRRVDRKDGVVMGTDRSVKVHALSPCSTAAAEGGIPSPAGACSVKQAAREVMHIETLLQEMRKSDSFSLKAKKSP